MTSHMTTSNFNSILQSTMSKKSASDGRTRLLHRNGSGHCFLRIPTMTPEAPSNSRDISTDDNVTEPGQRPPLHGAIRSLPGSNDTSFPDDRHIRPERTGSSGQRKKTAVVNQPKQKDIVDDSHNSTVPTSGHRRTAFPGRVGRNVISRSADGNRKHFFQSNFAEATPVEVFRNRICEIPPVSKGVSRSKTDPEQRRSAGNRSDGSSASAGRRFRVTSGKSERACAMTKGREAQLTRNSLVIRIPGLVDSGLAGGRKCNGRSATTGVWDFTDSWINIKSRSERWFQKWGNTGRVEDSRNPYTSKIVGERRVTEAHGDLGSNVQRKVVERNPVEIADSIRQTKTVCQDPKTPYLDDDDISRHSASGSVSIPESDPVPLDAIDTEGVAALDRNSSSVLPFASDEAWRVIEQLRLDRLKQQEPQEERSVLAIPEHSDERRNSTEQVSEQKQQGQAQEKETEQTPQIKKPTEMPDEPLLTLLTECQTNEDQTKPQETDKPGDKALDAIFSNSTFEGNSFKATNLTKSATNLTRNNPSSNTERLRRILSGSGPGFARQLRTTETPLMTNVPEKHPRPPVAPSPVKRAPGRLVKSKSSATLRTAPNRCCYGDRGNGNEWPDGNYAWDLKEEGGVVSRGSFRVTPFHYDSRYLDYLQRPSLVGISRDKREAECGYEEAIAESVIKCTAWLNGTGHIDD